MNHYKPCPQGQSEYKTAVGTTDWNIPMFGYRSAFLIFGTTIVVLLLTTIICERLGLASGQALSVTGGLSLGLTIAYSQYFLERRKGFRKGFFLTAILVGSLCGILLWLLLVKEVMI